jgi:hypothetical protein
MVPRHPRKRRRINDDNAIIYADENSLYDKLIVLDAQLLRLLAVDGGEVEVELGHHLLVGFVLEEEGEDFGAAGGGEFFLVRRLGVGGVVSGDELVAVFDALRFAEGGDVVVDVSVGHAEVFGDLLGGPAVEEPAEDGESALGWLSVELGAVGLFTDGGEAGGFWDFAAVEESAGEVGDELVPAGAGDEGDVGDAVAGAAGEGGFGIADFGLRIGRWDFRFEI